MLFFVSLITLLGAFIAVSKRDARGSAAESLGGLWCESVLAEYDLPLQQRYGIFGFYGSSRETPMRLDFYADRSFHDKRNIKYQGSRVFLDPYSLNSTEHMKQQMVHVGKILAAENVLSGHKTKMQESEAGKTEKSLQKQNAGNGKKDIQKNRSFSEIIPAAPKISERGSIGSSSVLASLPSSGASGGCSAARLKDAVRGMHSLKDMVRKGSSRYFLDRYLFVLYRDHVNDKALEGCYFDNEIEYVICGHPDDEKNLRGVRRRIIAVREVMNMMYILQDPEMNEKTLALAEIIAPGPQAAAVQKLLQAGWALAESRNDYQLLIQNKKVPLRKDRQSWAVDLESILESRKGERKKKNESDEAGESEETSITFKKELPCIDPGNSHGETYEDYLRFFTSVMGEEICLLRMMDLIQINMQYGWNKDFLLREHYCGLDAEFKVNGHACAVKREYYPGHSS